MFKKKVTFKILLLLIASDIFETAVHFFFKKSTLQASCGQVTDLASAAVLLKAVFLSPFLWAGLLMVVTVFVLWSLVLSKIDLSVAVPIASFSYILVPVVSVVFLHERISALRGLGVFFVLVGVILVSLSSKEKAGQIK
ncbi:MAG TPA: EamA family transporter [Candidatus Omnitrophota bacterium]|nr:EamA family transporter [Candidatus Omnitrophota bacterium]HPT38760.1 EamA family transporter [Candidatus Omnitrophota bacterium]